MHARPNDTALPDRGHSIIYASVPDFVAPAMATLYGSLYASLPLLCDGGLQASTYVRWADGHETEAPESIFLFEKTGHGIRVLNEGMRLDAEAVHAFCERLFTRDSHLHQIDFHAIAPPPGKLPRPSLRWLCTEDIVIDLPNDEQSYLNQLGRSTRKSLQKYLTRTRREMNNFSHVIRHGYQIDEKTIRQIVGFNHARMEGKARVSALDEHAIRQLIVLMHAHGMAGLVLDSDQLCAGTLACRLGSQVFSIVNAHDPCHDHLALGNVSRHLMILAAIAAGADSFHLMGGNFSTKRATLGLRKKLFHLTVYRSGKTLLQDARGISRWTLRALSYQLHRWVEDQETTPSRSPLRLLTETLNKFRHQWQKRRRLAKSSEPTPHEKSARSS